MMRIIWIVAFFGIFTGGICNNAYYPFNSRWWLSATEEPFTEKPKEERSVCVTQQCKDLANRLLESMNRTVDPCEDFYEYACGNWGKHNPLPKDVIRWNLLAKSQRIVEDRLIEIIHEPPKPEDFHATRVAKRAFKACLDTDGMEKLGLQPLVSTMWRAGGWPLIMEEDEWDEKMYAWQNVDDYYARLIGLNSFHDVHTDMNYWKRDRIYLIISSPRIPRHMNKIDDDDDVYVDSSEENNDSKEGSQERGSEERGDLEIDEVDDEDVYKLKRRKLIKRMINVRAAHEKRMNDRNKVTRKHIGERKLKERTKRATIKTEVHNKKHSERRSVDRRINHAARKMIERPSKHESVFELNRIKKPAETNSPRNNKRNKNDDNDLYFEDVDNENGNSEDREENNGDGNIENDDETYSYNNDGSGSGDHDWDDEDYSGSGDFEGDHGSGSGSGDHEWDYEDGSGSGDDSDYDDGSGDDSDESEDADKNNREKQSGMKKKYVEYMLNVSTALSEARGVSIPRETLKRDIVKLLQFQIKLVKCINTYGEEIQAALGTFQRKYNRLNPRTRNGRINWIKKVKDLFSNGGMEIDKDTVIFASDYKYIKELRRLLDVTPSRTIVNYIHWNFLGKVIHVTTKEMRNFYYNWDDTKAMDTKRTKNCIEEINAKYILGYEYVKRYFPEKVLQTASDMVDEIQKEVEYEIKKSPWMNNRIRDIILNKLIYMGRAIGYPNSYRNTTVMKDNLKGLSVGTSHFENTLSIMRYVKVQDLKSIFSKHYPDELDIDPLIVNAFFSVFENSIEITAADFQNPIYDSKQPWYTNYGMIGLIMSHEVNHGFDVRSRLIDKQGKYVKWSEKMHDAYLERAKCFIHQFNKYSVVDNKTANIRIENYGRQTVGENIADTMGLKAVFRAYLRRLRECEKSDPMLPGLEDLSNEQLFFLSFAHLWCEVTNQEKLSVKLKYDPHSLGPLRVIGSVSNTEGFAEAYNCPLGSPMNPIEKCSIWK